MWEGKRLRRQMEELIFKKRKDSPFSDKNEGNGGRNILRQGTES